MRIVIIDDETVICEGLVKIIESSEKEWIVEEIYTNSEEGLEFCDWDNIDLLLADINMPNIDGLTLVDILRERGYDTQVIFISGYAEFEYAKKAIQQKAIDYIIKPVSVKNLLNAIKKAEETYNHRKQLLYDENFIKNNIKRITRSFIYEMVFETRRISIAEMEQNLKFCMLENKSFLLFNFILDIEKRTLEQIIDKLIGDNQNIYLFGDSQPIYTVVLWGNKNTPFELDLIIKVIKDNYPKVIFGEAQTTDNINDLAGIFQELMVRLKDDLKGFNKYWEAEKERNDISNTKDHTYSIHVHKVVKYIKDNYSKKISLEKLSEEIYVHPTYLSNLFKKQTGYTVVDYINSYRIEMAKKLLLDSRNKIYWVTEQVGFTNERYFSQIFKKVTGLTPVQYKQNSFFTVQNK